MKFSDPKTLICGYDVMVACQLPKRRAIQQKQILARKRPKYGLNEINAMQPGCKPGLHACAALALWILNQNDMARQAAAECEGAQ